MSKLVTLIPDRLKPVLRPVYYSYRRLRAKTIRHKSLEGNYDYWRQPDDGHNEPGNYLNNPMAHARSGHLLEIMKRYTDLGARILEPGCNVGRNLNYLFEAGFRNLEGIEISKNAVELLHKSYPEMAQHITVHIKPIEEALSSFEDDAFDVVFTMAVLQHIHTESEWIFPEIVRITKSFLILAENEDYIHWRHFPRNYKKVFETLGMKQVEVIKDGEFFAKVFKKA